MNMLSMKSWRWGGLLAVSLLCGCPEQHTVQVTMKKGATSAAAPDESTEAAPVGYGNLHGVVTFDGDPKAPKKVVAKGDASVKDSAVCAAEDAFDETFLVNSANKGIRFAVVYLDKAPKAIKPELKDPPTAPVFFDQKMCRFIPHVVAFRIGQPFKILSDDSVPHNTHTNPNRNDAFNQTVPPNERVGVDCKYKKPETAPISVVCDFHGWMKAYHFPVDHPYFAVTDENGKFRIDGLPAGPHTFNVWHESASGGMLERKLTIEITPDNDTEKNFTYGAAKFAANSSPSRGVHFERLLEGGEIHVTRKESK